MRRALMILLLQAPAAARAAETLVVLSEPLSSAHREALDGLRAELGETIEIASADRSLPPGPHGVVVAFGSRAALRARRAGAPMVVALAPAYRGENPMKTVRVAMTPSPDRFVTVLAAAGVRRLFAVRSGERGGDFLRSAAEAGKRVGVTIEEGTLSSAQDLPQALRKSGRDADAIWLAPDPAVVSPEAFAVAREYARARAILFFAPAAGLVKDEVRGELTVTFRDCGREAGRAAREILAGHDIAEVVYAAGPIAEGAVILSTVSRSNP